MNIPYELPTGADFRRAIAANLARIAERNKRPEVRAELDAAWAQAREAARLLRERYGATRVRLFGSLARDDADEGFDIDIAVEGIPGAQFFDAYSDAGRLIAREFDLIDVKDAPPLLRKRIEQDGVDLP